MAYRTGERNGDERDARQARPQAPERFAALDRPMDAAAYNYEHFRATHVGGEVRRTVRRAGVAPGEPAPDFELPRVGGGTWRLAHAVNPPVLLRFGSYSCPITVGSVEPLKRLMAHFGERVQMVDVLVRQGHPGPRVPAYDDEARKLADAQRYKEDDDIPWTVLVDDLQGTVHQAYGALADPTYLIDVDGRVAFYGMWAHVPTLFEAVEALLAQGGRGVVRGGVDRRAHLAAAVSNGWPALRRGLPQSAVDLETSVPLSAAAAWLGYQLRPLLAPLTQRERPLPPAAKAALGAAAAVGALLVARRALRPPAARVREREPGAAGAATVR